ncbi:hypothetical protein NC652_039448 [Populus alba x Populus x berolinensis]|nr:hypothetical protein NC652_039448 [Populus alba x Populus x berolinensis]
MFMIEIYQFCEHPLSNNFWALNPWKRSTFGGADPRRAKSGAGVSFTQGKEGTGQFFASFSSINHKCDIVTKGRVENQSEI